mmetsp:Transcript_35675/g.48616  ORF Transcript_35675/g.48616 Transcript_35675/m.48616 type:complete len:82 (+) Transcript_35675:10-255(+)
MVVVVVVVMLMIMRVLRILQWTPAAGVGGALASSALLQIRSFVLHGGCFCRQCHPLSHDALLWSVSHRLCILYVVGQARLA